MTALSAVAIAVVLAAGSARADDGDKSQAIAMTLAAGGTAAGLAMATAALTLDMPYDARRALFAVGGTAALIMPTTGHWYARGSMQDGSVGGYMRLAGGAVVLVGGVAYAAEEAGSDESSIPVEKGIIYAGFALLAAGAIVDIATTPASVRRANRANRRSAPTRSLALAPRGVALIGSF